MLHCVAKPTRQPLRASPATVVATSIGYSSAPTMFSKASGLFTSRAYPAGRVLRPNAREQSLRIIQP